jgi:hypothetical protein
MKKMGIFFPFFLSFFFFYKIGGQKGGTGSAWEEGVVISGRGKEVGKEWEGEYGTNPV